MTSSISKVTKNGSSLNIEWKDGEKNGQGTFTFVNGDKYVGEVKDDKMHGQGTYTKANGKVYKGIFEQNKLIKKQ